MNIILLEPNLTWMRSLEIQLRGKGHHVIAFSQPGLAEAYLFQQPPADLLILDCRMIAHDPAALLERYRRYLPHQSHITFITDQFESIAKQVFKDLLGISVVIREPATPDIQTLLDSDNTISNTPTQPRKSPC